MDKRRIADRFSDYLQARRELEGGLYLDDEIKSALAENVNTLESFGIKISGCRKCELGGTRTKFVFGKGNPDSEVVFIGEAPGQDEDLQGIPFVGRAGKLLDEILAGLEFTDKEIYICNILKCRPPKNRDPLPDEIEKCEPYLWKQLELIRPKIIVALGRIAAQTLLQSKQSLSNLKKTVHNYRGIPLFLTYHPAFILRNNNYRSNLEEDLRKVRNFFLTGKFES